MAPRFSVHGAQVLPTKSVYSLISSRSESPGYPPPYDSEHDYNAFANDIEEEAPVRRPRPRREPLPAFDSDPRFQVQTPSPFVRAALLLFIAFLFWLAFSMRKALWVAGGMGLNRRWTRCIKTAHVFESNCASLSILYL
jgi:hypothetical protein